MELMTERLQERFREVGRQPIQPIIIAHYFNPCGRGDWYATEYYPEEQMFFGFVSLFGDWNDEWGYFGIDELAEYKHPIWGLGIERDLHWMEIPAIEVERIREQCPWMVEACSELK